jgi:hypothetical protein
MIPLTPIEIVQVDQRPLSPLIAIADARNVSSSLRISSDETVVRRASPPLDIFGDLHLLASCSLCFPRPGILRTVTIKGCLMLLTLAQEILQRAKICQVWCREPRRSIGFPV